MMRTFFKPVMKKIIPKKHTVPNTVSGNSIKYSLNSCLNALSTAALMS